MNVRIFWVRVMKCMRAQTRPRFILSSKRVFGGMEFKPMLTPREKSPSTGKCPQRRIEPTTLWTASPSTTNWAIPAPTHTLKWPGHNCVQIMCNTASACHVQHVLLCVTWYKGTAQLLSLTEFRSHLFQFYFIGWAINQLGRHFLNIVVVGIVCVLVFFHVARNLRCV